jgi:hypothetical protein
VIFNAPFTRRLTPKMLNVARKRPWTCPNYGRYFWDTTLAHFVRLGTA